MIRNRRHRRHARAAVAAVATELDAEGADWARSRARGAASCGGRLGVRNLGAVLDHEKPLPDPASDQARCAGNWPTIRETKRMYRKLAGQADHPVVKNAMLELAPGIGRLACNGPGIPNVHMETMMSSPGAVRRPRRPNFVKWWPVMSRSRRLPNSGEFS
jgi:hypothetical protein